LCGSVFFFSHPTLISDNDNYTLQCCCCLLSVLVLTSVENPMTTPTTAATNRMTTSNRTATTNGDNNCLAIDYCLTVLCTFDDRLVLGGFILGEWNL